MSVNENKDQITQEEYNKLFEQDENGCYIRLIIPAMNDYPEMNLIGKKKEDYTIDEIVHSKKYRQFLHDKIIENKIDLSENNNNVSNEKITNNVNSKTLKNNKNKLSKDKLKSFIRIILFGLISGLMFIIFLIQFVKEHNIIYILISIISLISSLLCLYTLIYERFNNRK